MLHLRAALMTVGRTCTLATLTVSLIGCAVNPVTGQQQFVLMSEQQELAAGRQANQQVLKQYQIYPDQQLQIYVTNVGQRLAEKSHRANLTYHFTVVDSTEINAFALPGGYIYITRGLLAYLNSEAELAAVLGHEIGHVTARHGVRQQTSAQAASVGAGVLSILLPQLSGAGIGQSVNLLGTALLRGYGREHELEADRLGADYLARSGYNPQAMLGVIRTLKEHEIFDRNLARLEGRPARAYHGVFSTHPDSDTRLREIVDHQSQQDSTSDGFFRDRFLDEIDGMVFGPSPAAGVLIGNAFHHRSLGFAIQFPPGWQVSNRPDQLVAIDETNNAQIQLTERAIAPGTTPQQLLAKSGITSLSTVESISAGGVIGVSGLTTVRTPGGTQVVRVSGIVLGEHGFVITGFARTAALQTQYDATFRSVAMSFHRLTDAERNRAGGQRLRIVNLKGSISWASLASASPLEKLAEDHLRLLNASPIGAAAPQTGRIKVVE